MCSTLYKLADIKCEFIKIVRSNLYNYVKPDIAENLMQEIDLSLDIQP